MTWRAFVAQARRLHSLEHQVCVRSGVGAGAALLLDFGELHDPDQHGYREADRSFVSECWWRLEDDAHVIVGSGDEDNVIRDRVQVVVGNRLEQAETFLPSYMLRLRFQHGLTLWVFPDDSREYAADSQEPQVSWYVTGRAMEIGWEE